MNTETSSCRGLVFAALLLVPLAATSCKRESASDNAAPTAEIRGEPIQPPATADAPPVQSAIPPTAAVPATPEPAPIPAAPAPVPAAAPAPAPVVSAAATQPETTATETADEPLVIGFEKLSSFVYEVPDDPADTNATTVAKLASQIPAPVKALDKRSVALKGFMLPLKVEGGLVTELLIMRDQSMCCFGAVPKINEWVSVKMTTKGVKPIMDQPVTLFGRLHVGEIRENGYLVGIYQMDGERMAGPLDL